MAQPAETRVKNDLAQSLDGQIIFKRMANHQNDVGLNRGVNELVSFRKRASHRLFDEHVPLCGDGGHRHIVVFRRGSGDDKSVDLEECVLDIAVYTYAKWAAG